MLAGYAVKLVSITTLYVYMYLENKRRDREASTDSEDDLVTGIERGMLVSRYAMPLISPCLWLFLTINRTKQNMKTNHLDMYYRVILKISKTRTFFKHGCC